MATGRKNKKTDNRSLPLKIKIRRCTLELAGLTEVRVLDLCAGEGHIWRAMREHVKVTAYTPCDRAPRMAGTIKGEAERLLESFDLSIFDVIDVDTYGSPWECWLKLSARLRTRAVVFLTAGSGGTPGGSGGKLSRAEASALGIPLGWYGDLPLKSKLNKFAAEVLLATGCSNLPVRHVGCVRTQKGNTSVDYYAIVIQP